MGLRVEKLRLILEMQNKSLTAGISKSISDLTKLSKATEKNARAVDRALDVVEKAAKDAGTAQEQSWQRAINAAKKFELQMEKTARAVELSVFKIRASTAKSIGTLPAAFAQLDTRLGRSVQKIKSSVNSARTAIGILGGAAILAAPIKFAASFEKALANVDTLLVDSAVSIQQYEEQLLKLSVTTSKELIDLTQGLYQTISAGIPAVEGAGGAFEVLEKATRAAEAGLATTEQAVDAFTTVLNAYRDSALTASDVSDKLFTTVRIGKTTFPELAGSLGRVATVASKFGISLDEVLAAIAELTKNGLSSESAVTQLRAAILGLGRPADSVKQKLKELGVETGEAAFRSKGLIGVLTEVGEATNGSTDAIAELLPNVRALVGGLVLGGDNIDEFGRSLGQLRNSAGATDEAFSKISRTFSQTFAIFKSQVQSTLVVVGNRILPQVQEAFERFGNTISENQEQIADGVEAFAEALFSIGRFIVKFGPTIIKFMTTFFLVNRITRATRALAGFGRELKLVIAQSRAGQVAGQTFTKGFTKGAGAIPGIVGGLLKSPTLLGAVLSLGVFIADTLSDAISDALLESRRKADEELKKQLEEQAKLADKAAQRLGFSSFEDQVERNQQRRAGSLIEIGENAPRGERVAAGALQTVSAAFNEILTQVDGDLQTAQNFLAAEIEEEVDQLESGIRRARALAQRETNNILLLRLKLKELDDQRGDEADRLNRSIERGTEQLSRQEAEAKALAAKIDSLRAAPGQLASAEAERRSAAAAEAKAKADAERKRLRESRAASEASARLKASEQARRALLKGINTLRLKDALAAAQAEQRIAERALAAQAEAAEQSASIARAEGASARELVEIEARAAEERIKLIKAVEVAQGESFAATLELQEAQVDEQVKKTQELGERAQLAARRSGEKLAEISDAVQAKILSTLEAAERKRREVQANRVEEAQETASRLLQIETGLAAARARLIEETQAARPRTAGDVADAAEGILSQIDTFLSGELNRAQRQAANDAERAAAVARDKANEAAKRFAASGSEADKAGALAALAGSTEATEAARAAAGEALAGSGILASASGVIGIATAVDKAVDLIGKIGIFLESGLTDFGDKIGANFTQLADGIEAFPAQIEEFFGRQLPEFIEVFFERLPQVLNSLIPGLARAIPIAISALINAAPAIALGMAEVFLDPEFWSGILEASLIAFLEGLKEFFTSEFLQQIAALFAELGDLILGALTGGALGGEGGLFSAFGDAGGILGGALSNVLGLDFAGAIASGDIPSLGDIPGVGLAVDAGGAVADAAKSIAGLFAHSGRSVSGSSRAPNAAAFMAAAGAPGFQGGGLVEAVGAQLRGLFGTAFKDDVPATLQSGEFVLSRDAVESLGGPRGAEALNRGGAAQNFNVSITPSAGGADALLRSLIGAVTVEAATPGTALRQAVVGNDPFLGSQFVRGRT